MADLLASIHPAKSLPPGRYGASTQTPGVTLKRLDKAVAVLVAGRAGLSAVRATALGATLPEGPQRVVAGELCVVGIGPGRWQVSSDGDPDALVEKLDAAFAPEASAFDQSGGTVLLSASGPHLPDVLAKLVALDLDPNEFHVGTAATTVTAHVGVTFWREDDGFVFSVGRSFEPAFLRAFVQSAAEFGIALVD